MSGRLLEKLGISLTKMTKSKFDRTWGHCFLPRDQFDKVLLSLTPDLENTCETQIVLQLMDILPDHAGKDDLALATWILQHAKIVFLITIHIEVEQLYAAMSFFRSANFTNSRLPLPEWCTEDLEAESMTHPLAITENTPIPQRKRIWTVKAINKFQAAQWEFLAPVISTTARECNFGQRTMPFISKGTAGGGGAHGIVCKYKVHPAHLMEHARSSDGSCVIAVKAFRKTDKNISNVVLDWGREVAALAEMNKLRQKHIVRFVTAFTHGDKHDLEHYVVFEWADGGNLGDLWKKIPKPELSASRLKWAIKQLHGLAQALDAAHYLKDGMSYRHGDLKPANILWFLDGEGGYGTLKIGDWGEAKIHQNVTSLRQHTTAKPSTMRYEPPETLKTSLTNGERHVRSRLYDIWSFGCIALEFVIWLLYGQTELRRFNSSYVGEHGISETYYEVGPPSNRAAQVHGAVVSWMKHMAKDDLCHPGSTALGDLLRIVRTGLLVVRLPEGGGAKPNEEVAACFRDSSHSFEVHVEPPSIERTTPRITVDEPAEVVFPTDSTSKQDERLRADQLEQLLRQIVRKEGPVSYWHQGKPPKPAPVNSDGSQNLSAPSNSRQATGNLRTSTVGTSIRTDYGHPPLDPEDWAHVIDNDFAASVWAQSNYAELNTLKKSPMVARLCNQCQEFRERLLAIPSGVPYDLKKLRQDAKAKVCDLCCMLWQACRNDVGQRSGTVRFRNESSALRIDEAKYSVLTLLGDKDAGSQVHQIQTGLPELPEAGKAAHVNLLRHWLDDCDKNHFNPECKPSKASTMTGNPRMRMPTRLIAVGNLGERIVKLQEMRSADTGDWLALSYRWGDLPHTSTTRENLDEHIAGMKLQDLPLTFQHAVEITRALGHRYLWIDSMCIIQGKDGDFHEESKRMEHVYSGAYCVLAASCAVDQRSGFLLPRLKRKYVPVRSTRGDSGTLYVCEVIENFREHVLQGELNKRGWVLQEHALARRTIFFTESQTYWECGHGIRCETMTRMENGSAALLGDPDFPKMLSPAKHGERILRFQELYQQYSRLDLSSDYDRPTAIDGLQQRLLRAMNVRGGFGILEDPNRPGIFRRSLLWHRAAGVSSARPIRFPSDRERVPSWSWMSRSGGIDYFTLDWDGYAWQTIQSPWSSPSNSNFTLVGEVKALGAHSGVGEIIFDDPGDSTCLNFMAMVLGIEKHPKANQGRKHFVLVLRPVPALAAGCEKLYERIGAGPVLGRSLGADTIPGYVV